MMDTKNSSKTEYIVFLLSGFGLSLSPESMGSNSLWMSSTAVSLIWDCAHLCRETLHLFVSQKTELHCDIIILMNGERLEDLWVCGRNRGRCWRESSIHVTYPASSQRAGRVSTDVKASCLKPQIKTARLCSKQYLCRVKRFYMWQERIISATPKQN